MWEIKEVEEFDYTKDYLYNDNGELMLKKDWTPHMKPWVKKLCNFDAEAIHKSKYREERTIHLIKKYGKYMTTMRIFPKPEDMFEAIDMYMVWSEKQDAKWIHSYVSINEFAKRMKITPMWVSKYKKMEWYLEPYDYLKDLCKHNLIKKGLEKKFDSKIVKLMLSQHGIIEKSEKQVNVHTTWWLTSMTVNMPNISTEQLIAMTNKPKEHIEVIQALDIDVDADGN